MNANDSIQNDLRKIATAADDYDYRYNGGVSEAVERVVAYVEALENTASQGGKA